MTEQTMAAGFAASFAEYACEQGADRDVLLADSGLTEDDLSDQDNRIPVAAYQAMIGAAIRQTDDTALLLRHTYGLRADLGCSAASSKIGCNVNDENGPNRPFTHRTACCGAARRSRRSLRMQNRGNGELGVCGRS